MKTSFLKTITTLLTSFLLLFVFAFVNAQFSRQSLEKIKTSPAAKQTLSYQIIPAEGGTFGYDILSDNKNLIHQPSKPGLAGNKGFTKKADAEKVASLVIYKLSHNIMPPTVEKREMDSLKIKL